MPKFLVLYRSQVSAAAQMAEATPEQAQAGMEAGRRGPSGPGRRLWTSVRHWLRLAGR